MTAYNNSNLNEVTTIEYYDCMENLLDDDNQNQNNFSDLKKLIMESSDANYDDMSTPVPLVTTVGVNNTISSNLVPIHVEYEDDLIQKEDNIYGGGSTLNW